MHQSAGDHQTPFHTTRQRPSGLVTLIPQAKDFQVFLCPFLSQCPRQTVIAALGNHDMLDLFKDVEVEFLGNNAYVLFRGRKILIDVDATNIDLAAGLVYQRKNDADGGGLARAIGAQ